MTETHLDAGTDGADVTEGMDGADTQAADKGAETGAEGAADTQAGADTEAGGKTAGTLLDGADDGEEGTQSPSNWPDDWREKIAGDDEKLLGRLKRYSSPMTAMKAGLSAQDRIRSGELKQPLPEDATDEQVAEWRKENGIPVKSDEYQIPDIKGFEWKDEDKELAKSFFDRVHGKNYTQEQAAEALSWYTDLMAERNEQQFEQDTQAKQALEDDLRLELGAEYRPAVKMLARYVESIPGVGAQILDARLPDGTRAGDNKEFVLDLLERARGKYGDASFVAGDGGSTMAKRKEEIEQVMKTDIRRYRAEGMDKEYSKILEAEQRMSA